MLKYPRTRHLQGSRSQPGDEGLEGVPVGALHARWLVVEEKLDGANAGISFDGSGELRLQSRGHFLTGGARERHFDLFKRWAQTHRGAFYERLGSRFQLYGEWLYAKHTVFYDALPHYFLEFDVFDRQSGLFLDTPSRQALLAGLPIRSVPVLFSGITPAYEQLTGLVRPSLYKSPRWRERLAAVTEPGRERETDSSDLAEGLYLKVEEGGQVVERLKFVRASFLTAVHDSESHWLDRPVVPNGLAPDVDLFVC